MYCVEALYLHKVALRVLMYEFSIYLLFEYEDTNII